MDLINLGKMKCMKSRYKWELNRAGIDGLNPGGAILSPTFPIHHRVFQLHLLPDGISDRSSRYASLFLKLVSKSKIKVKYRLWISDEKDRRYGEVERTEMFDRKTKVLRGSKNFVLKSELDSLYSVTGELKIHCEIIFGLAVRENYVRDEPPRKRPRLEEVELSNPKSAGRFEKYFDNERLSDATFVLPDGRRIHAHAIVLESRSDTFAEMFGDEDSVDIKGIDYEVLYETLRFVYTDTVENLDELAEKLLEPATRFGLDDLKTLCERNLCERVTKRSAIGLLVLAEDKNLLGLRERTKRFIAANVNDIVHLPEFEEVMVERPSVALEIVRCGDVDVKKEVRKVERM